MTAHLTPAEWRSVRAVWEWDSEKVAAAKLGMSEHTVHNHIRSAYSKLGVCSRREMAQALSLPLPVGRPG
jgi:DNA-binding NarL/FixJ family response regulator